MVSFRKIFDGATNVFITPVGLAFLVVHWIVVAYAFTADFPDAAIGNYTLLAGYLGILNAAPLLLTFGAMILLKPFVSQGALQTVFLILMCILVSLQWLLLGSWTQLLLRCHKPPPLDLRLKDQSN